MRLGRPPGIPRSPTQGRKKGTKNKITRDILALLEEIGCDPIRGMAEIAMDPTTDRKLRHKCYSDIAQYVYPRKVAQTIGNPDGSPMSNNSSVVIYIPTNGRDAHPEKE